MYFQTSRSMFHMTASLMVLLVLCTHAAPPAVDGCAGGQVHLQIQLPSSTTKHTPPPVLEGMPAGFGGRLPHKPTAPLPLVMLEPSDASACQPLSQSFPQGSAVVVTRGGCEFTTKTQHVAAANATLMVLVDTDPESCVIMGTNSSEQAASIPHDVYAISMSAASGKILTASCAAAGSALAGDAAIPRDGSGMALGGIHGGCTVTAWLLRVPVFDVASLLLAAIAVCTVAGGALLVGLDHRHMLQLPMSSTGDDTNKKPSLEEDAAVILTPGAAVGFVVVSSILLLVLYFFLDDIFYWVLVVLYATGAVQAMTYLSSTFLSHLSHRLNIPHYTTITCTIPLLGPTSIVTLCCALSSLAIALLWCAYQASAWGWVAQDVMGVCLMVVVLRLVRLPDLQVASLLLGLAFCYDVFWVFIQPRLFGGSSVMAAVATGGQSSHLLPMLLVVPHGFGGHARGLALLGFGDVVLPGTLVSFARMVDVDMSLPLLTGYYLPTLIAYAVGVLATYTALYFEVGGTEGQPALLYLVPATLGTMVALAAVRGHLRGLWKAEQGVWEEARGEGYGEIRGGDVERVLLGDGGGVP